jgi:hypothetical protein
MFTRKRKGSMCKLCEIIGDILPRWKTVMDVLLDRMLVVTHRKSDYTSSFAMRSCTWLRH